MSSQCGCGLPLNTPKPIENKSYAPIKTAYNLQGSNTNLKRFKKKKYTLFEMILIIVIIILFYHLVIKDIKFC